MPISFPKNQELCLVYIQGKPIFMFCDYLQMSRRRLGEIDSVDGDYRSRLVAFYKQYNPEKLSSVDQILAAYAVPCFVFFIDVQGREDQLFSELEARYGTAKKAAAPAAAPTTQYKSTRINPSRSLN